MKSTINTRGRQRPALSIAACAAGLMLALPLALPANATPQADPTAAEEVSEGALHWGVRGSIRNYLENYDHTAGWIEARQGATYKKGDPYAVFPNATGTVDADAKSAQLHFDGELEMFGFGEAWLHFNDLNLSVADGVAELTVDMIEAYNDKDPHDDVAIARWQVDPADFVVTDDVVSVTAKQCKFTEITWKNFLPALGGEPSYAPPNNDCDDMAFSVRTPGAADPDQPVPDPDPQPVPDPDEPPAPWEGPYGESVGKPMEGNTSYITVTPGYGLYPDKPTTLKIEGHDFDPGPAVKPGEGKGGVYVVVGQPKDINSEEWRRSKGGSTGSGPDDQFTYGMPRFVAHQNTGDGDVADGQMDANGYWSYTLELPGATFPGFFGDEINCIDSPCAIMSFGAHGVINAKNEALTRLYFEGDGTEASWPERPAEPPVDPPVEVPDPAPEKPAPDPKPDQPKPDPKPVPDPSVEKNPHGESTGKNDAGAELTVSPAYELADKSQVVTLTGKNYPTSNNGSHFGGAYILFGYVDTSRAEGWGPAKNGRGGFEYIYIEGEENQSMVSYPGNTTVPGYPMMDENGDWTAEFTIAASQFKAFSKDIDCYEVQCGVFTIGAHGQANADAEVFTPVYFNASDKPAPDPDKAPGQPNQPPPAGGMPVFPPVANPPGANPPAGGGFAPPPMVAGQNINTGVLAPENTGQTEAFLGLFLIAAGTFALTVVATRRKGGLTNPA